MEDATWDEETKTWSVEVELSDEDLELLRKEAKEKPIYLDLGTTEEPLWVQLAMFDEDGNDIISLKKAANQEGETDE